MNDTPTAAHPTASDPQSDTRTFTLDEIAAGFGTLMSPLPPLTKSGFMVIFAERYPAHAFAAWARRMGYTVSTPDAWTVRLPHAPTCQ